jgi:hypothetical protein
MASFSGFVTITFSIVVRRNKFVSFMLGHRDETYYLRCDINCMIKLYQCTSKESSCLLNNNFVYMLSNYKP